MFVNFGVLKNISVDVKGFESHMSNQRNVARESGKFIQNEEESECRDGARGRGTNFESENPKK